jgi:hypothetical protein
MGRTSWIVGLFLAESEFSTVFFTLFYIFNFNVVTFDLYLF